MRPKRVSIIGRPNVGKSTLFNRLIQKKLSIMSDIEGTTRDRITYPVEWLNKTFNLIDTGGFTNKNNQFQDMINIQVEFAIKESDLIIFLVSAQEGFLEEDLQIAKKLKNFNKPIILAINKVDNINIKNDLDYFYKVGIKKQIPISSIHGIGISDLLDEIVLQLNLSNQEYTSTWEENRIGIIGKPNTGKSTLINTLLNDERVIVSDIPGTTRDAVDTKLTYNKTDYIFTDTAGLKKNKKSLDDIEFYSELRTNFAISSSSILLLLIDPTQGINQIDEKILQILQDQYKPTIIAINKIDLLTPEELKQFKKDLTFKFKFFNDPYIIEFSALEKKGTIKIFKAIQEIKDSLNQKITTSEINDFLIDIQTIKKVPRHNGINVRLTFMTYSNNKYPHFIIFSNYPNYIHFSYERFIVNNLKKIYSFKGVPIKITFKKNI